MAQRRPHRSASHKGHPRKGAAPARELDPPKGILEAGLYVIATPIGNMGDMTHRAVETLTAVDALAAEDTRVSAKLLSRYSIEKPHPTFSCHEHNEHRVIARVLSLIEEGRAVGLVSDAGMPGISDPGYRVVQACVDAGVKVEVRPGANAATMALVASGLPTSSYTFLGFLSRKAGKRKAVLEAERESPHTLVMYESPHRVAALLHDAHEVLGDRPAAVALELTKMFETFYRGTLSELVEVFADEKPKGEVTVVIEGVQRKAKHDADES